MAKLIKKGAGETRETSSEEELQSGELTGMRKAPIIDRNTFEARSDGQQIRERAQQQADEILAKAQAEAQELIARANEAAAQLKEHSHTQGYKEGREQGAAELAEVVARESMRSQELEEQIVPQLTELALRIARKVLGKELEFHPEAVVQIVKQALSEKARQRREVSLRVHPDDLQIIREHRGELLELLSRTKDMSIIEDPAVERHGVIIETEAGTIDAQLETQLAIFEKVLKGVR